MQHVGVLIVGGGIGGLALARALELRGFSPAVLERDVSIAARAQGYSLTIQGGMRVLRALGLEETIRSHAGGMQHSGQHILSPCGRVVVALGSGPRNQGTASKTSQENGRHQQRNVYIPRQRLRTILAESLKQGTIRWGTSVSDFVEEVNQGRTTVRVSLENGTIMTCDVLVAADGVHSKIRAKVLSDPLRFMGVISICGINKCSHPLCLSGSVQVLDGRNRLFIKPFDGAAASQCSDESSEQQQEPQVMWQLTIPMLEDTIQAVCSDQAKLLNAAQSATKGWGAYLRHLMESTPPRLLRGGPLLDRDSDACAPPAGCQVAFLGDAAHPMSPFKGQGANQALLDAVALADALQSVSEEACGINHRKLADALEQHHASMRERVRPYVKGSRRNVEFLHSAAATPGCPSMLRFFGVATQDSEGQPTVDDHKARVRGLNAELRAGGFWDGEVLVGTGRLQRELKDRQ